jgi:hypothetical protein
MHWQHANMRETAECEGRNARGLLIGEGCFNRGSGSRGAAWPR